MGRPIIALTPEAIRGKGAQKLGAHCDVAYTQAIEAAGGVPMILPLTHVPEVLDPLLHLCQGLVLTGGGDLTEKYYQPKLAVAERATLGNMNGLRDDMEVYLVREALDADLPLLAICRGMQVLNVAATGTLIPDLPLRRSEAMKHRPQGDEILMHPVEWESGTRLADVLGQGCESVNSTHHQAVDMLAPGFEPAAHAPDGVIEAMEKSGARFCCGVQFHPERLVGPAPQFRRLFEALVDSCRP